MIKNILRGLAVGAVLVILLVVLYRLYSGSVPQPSRPVTAPAAPPTGTPPPAAPALKESGPPGPVVVPPMEAPGPPQKAAPSPEAKSPGAQGTGSPSGEPQDQYGLLVGRYRNYRDADKMLARLKKQGISGFIRRDKEKSHPYQVWAGPYASREETLAAEKSLHALLKKSAKVGKLPAIIPK
jgi:cell division protein FtsN